MIISAASSGKHATVSANWTAIQGLTVKLPRGVGDFAFLILNVPNPYAEGNNFPGANFGLQVDGKMLDVTATFTSGEPAPPNSGRVPTTLCVVVPLIGTAEQTVVAVWNSVRNSVVIIDTPATLTAIVN